VNLDIKDIVRLPVKILCCILAVLLVVPWLIVSMWFYMVYMSYIIGFTDWSDEHIKKEMEEFKWCNRLTCLKARPDYILDQLKSRNGKKNG
jgi:hypothetical protein